MENQYKGRLRPCSAIHTGCACRFPIRSIGAAILPLRTLRSAAHRSGRGVHSTRRTNPAVYRGAPGLHHSKSALLLLVLGVRADDHHTALAADDLALFTDRLYRRSYFHGNKPPSESIGGGSRPLGSRMGPPPALSSRRALYLERQVMRPRVRS